jgi:hypothetical protein
MTLSEYSKKKFYTGIELWRVDKDYADPMFNYLVYGYSPGSFFTSVLANDFLSAVARSHPANTITALKALCGWIRDYVPAEAMGSYKAVDHWTQLTHEERRTVLEQRGLIHTAKEETWLALKGEPAFN